MKKLSQLLKESQDLDYRRMNVGEEETQGMTKEEKRAFVEAVSAYRQLGEMISHKGNLAEIHESIKGIVENANNLTLKETGDWFDRVTVQRHMKSMNESFKIFSNTIKEVSTLQQRLESSYDEIGEVLGKYYEIKEGNEFGAERAKAIAAGEDSFEVDGKEFPVKDVDADDKKNAEEFANESMKLTSLIRRNEELTGGQKELDVDGDGDIEADDLADLRAGKKADESVNEITLSQALKSVSKGETSSVEGIKMSRTLANAIASWAMSSPYGMKYGKAMLKSPIGASWKMILSPNFGVEKYLSRWDKAQLQKVKPELEAAKKKLGL